MLSSVLFISQHVQGIPQCGYTYVHSFSGHVSRAGYFGWFQALASTHNAMTNPPHGNFVNMSAGQISRNVIPGLESTCVKREIGHQPGVEVHTCCPSAQEAEAQDCKFKTGLVYIARLEAVLIC